MTKQQFKEQQRQVRLAKTHQAGLAVANIMLGKVVSNYDNSHIWKLRNSIAKEVEPEIRKQQLAWAKSNKNDKSNKSNHDSDDNIVVL